MFNISNEEIMKMTDSRKTYLKGMDYYRRRRVEFVSFDKNNLRFNFLSYGSDIYEITITLKDDLKIDHVDCTCPANMIYDGLCKHGVASLADIMERDSLGRFKDVKIKKTKANKNEEIENFLSFFKDKDILAKTPINLEINYDLSEDEYSDVEISTLNFRIGGTQLYVIRNLKEFIKNIKEENDIIFGKKFTFFHDKHTFKKEDMAVIEFLTEMYEIEEPSHDRHYYSYGGYKPKSRMFKDKRIILSSESLKRFFTIIGHRTFNANIFEHEIKNISIIEKDIPLDLNISENENDLVLDIKLDDSLIQLYPNGEYFLYEDSIYKISKEQNENLAPILSHVAETGINHIDIPKEYSSKFITEVIPHIEKISNIRIDEKVQSSIYKPDLKAEIYMDRIDDEIILELIFKYEDISIKPFIDENQENFKDNKILIRDKEKENKIMNLIEESSFKINNEKIYIDDEEDIFNFMLEKLPEFQELSDVYYSNQFKSMEIKDPSSFSGSLRLENEHSMLEFSFDIEGVSHQELPDIFRSLKEKKKYYKLKDGSFLPLEYKELDEVYDIITSLNINEEDLARDIMQIPKFRAMYLDDELSELDLRFFKRNLDFKELVQNIKEPEDIDYETPEELKGVLRNYQETGLKWFKTLSSYGFGGILADDMGLGKTLQTIAFLLSEKAEKGSEPSIIIAPTSLVYNWESEIKKFSKKLTTLVISGSKEEREEKIKDIGDYDVILTSYPLIRRDVEFYRDLTFRYCILDEAQHIKNATSQTAISVKTIRAKNCFALTGTPIENSLTELWSIFDFIMPGYLLSRAKFMKDFEKPIVKDRDNKVLDKLGKHIRPFILRRLKKDVLKELPDKIENTLVAELTEDQKKIYLAYLENIKNELDDEIKEKGFGRSHIKILAGLTRLRQICCHPSMFIEGYQGKSGKLMMLEEIVNDFIAGGHRILLFSQFTSMLKIIGEMLDKNNIEYMNLDGSTPMEKRGQMVNEFNAGKADLFLISLKAGGTGLNLTGADTVIHFDPWWNPAVEEQATDRVHRIGQENVVHVMKLISKGTIEEKILELQERKKKLIDSVIKPGETLVSKLSEDELRSMFDMTEL